MGELLLGIDVGTASSKGVLLRPDGSLVADVRADHAMEDVPRPGWAEQDAEVVWLADACGIARWLVEAVPAGDRIAGVATSAIGPTQADASTARRVSGRHAQRLLDPKHLAAPPSALGSSRVASGGPNFRSGWP